MRRRHVLLAIVLVFAAPSCRSFAQYTEQVFETLLAVQTDDLCAEADDVRRSVFIDPLGIATTDFGLDTEQKCALIASGAAGTRDYLRAPSTACPQRHERQDPRPR